ncbi:T9SS type A sorting domain-containing protein [bacterium]|nr:T9SS type A sorting domain-containing protein [bacterium]
MRRSIQIVCTVALVGFLFLTALSHAQEWAQQQMPAGSSMRYFWNPHDTSEVVGCRLNEHQMYRSLDGGRSWAPSNEGFPAGPHLDATMIYHPTSPDTQYYVEYQRLFRSFDGGVSWQDCFPEQADNIRNVEVSPVEASRITCFDLNGTGGHLISEDYGDSWTIMPVPEGLANLRFDPFSEQHLIATSSDSLFESFDAGVTWNPYPAQVTDLIIGTISDILFDPVRPDTIYVNWYNDIVPAVTMTRFTISPEPHVDILAEGTLTDASPSGLLVAKSSSYPNFQSNLYTSLDGGDTWNQIAEWFPYTGQFDGVLTQSPNLLPNPSDPQSGLLFEGVYSFHTTTGGIDPGTIVTGVDVQRIAGIYPRGDDTMVLSGHGQLWNLRQDVEPTWPILWDFVSDVASLNDACDTLFAAGLGFRRSVDGGNSWTVTPGTFYVNNTSNVLVLPSDPPRVLFDYNGMLYKSTDWGNSYNPVEESGLPDTWGGFDIYTNPSSPNQVWFHKQGDLYLSEDYGDHFSQELETESNMIDLEMTASNQILYMLHPEGTISYWIRDTEALVSIHVPSELGAVFAIALRPGTLGHFFIGTFHGVHATQNYGGSWTEIEGDFEGTVTSLAFSQEGSDLYVGTQDDGLWIGSDLFPPNALADDSNDLPATITLLLAWPNPFNASTRIAYDLPRAGRVNLAVYDLLGRRVALLDEGLRGAGRHEVSWEADAASGTYIVRLQSESFDQAQKVLLVR